MGGFQITLVNEIKEYDPSHQAELRASTSLSCSRIMSISERRMVLRAQNNWDKQYLDGRRFGWWGTPKPIVWKFLKRRPFHCVS